MSGPKRRFREVRKDAALDLFPSSALFAAGILCMPAFLFNPSLPLRFLQFLLFWLFAWAVGKRISLAATLIAGASIVLFNLFVPYGETLAVLWSFPITSGALKAGLERAVTVEGLILLSRATIRSDLRLPGTVGALVGESFRYFDRIVERKGGIERKDPIGGIDRLMGELWDERDELRAAAERRAGGERRGWLGYPILAAAALSIWAPWLLLFAA